MTQTSPQVRATVTNFMLRLGKRADRDLNWAFWSGYRRVYGNTLPGFIANRHVGRVPRALVDVQRRGGRGTP